MKSRTLTCVLLMVIIPWLLVSPVAASAGSQFSRSGEGFHLEVNEQLDLVLHLFAHIDAGESPASNYDQKYVAMINQQKEQHGINCGLEKALIDWPVLADAFIV
ncbi:MAG: hypothetical protein UMV23_05100 [Halanaerobium sp.]|nr:hypothetical protein [Halanaerobium sp.]